MYCGSRARTRWAPPARVVAAGKVKPTTAPSGYRSNTSRDGRTDIARGLSFSSGVLPPSSGLDPIVRRDILGAVMRTIAHEGRTVLFSSHLLDEVDMVADHVTMIAQGKVALSAPLADIKRSHRSLAEAFFAHVGHAASEPDS